MITGGTYDAGNVFARILRGEMACDKVFEDTETFAFMDIMPRAPGHTLVIPKAGVRNILDATDAQLAALMRTTRRISRAVMIAFSAQGVTIQQFNEPAGGQVVFHLHFHVLPRFEGQPTSPPGIMGDKAEISANAEKIRCALGLVEPPQHP